jgi:hypothetical protein
MTTWFVVDYIPRGIPYADAFTERTYELIEDFEREHDESGGPPLLSNAIVIASDVLLDEHGPDAAWERLDMLVFLHQLADRAPALLPYAHRARAALVLFLEHLARRGIVPPEVALRARSVPPPREGRNRAERRFLARQARRRRRPILAPADEDVRVILPTKAERMAPDDDF